ncbi:MAG: SprB repeat-containing protein, partial [Tenacibaculum sp.]|nr:SprB repeat-containing protein [Tenacibaculum sp.]
MNKKILTLIVFLLGTVLSFSQIDGTQKKVLNKVVPESGFKTNAYKEKVDRSLLRKPDVAFTQRLATGGLNVQGNITFVGNNILNRDTDNSPWDFNFYNPNTGNIGSDVTSSITADDAYDSDLVIDFNGFYYFINNGNFFMDYIDIDDVEGIPGNNTTFSSSKSTLNLPNCSRVVYAGLYWAGVFPYDTWEDEGARPGDYRDIKFRLPGGPYQDITADEVIYDNGTPTQRPYVCFKDVTADLQTLSDPNGDYYAANIRATTGWDENYGLGGSAGWVLVVIYENSTQSSKNISVFDGFSTIDGSNSTDISFSGFTTVPSGPVRTQLLTATLEGDTYISGDNLQVQDVSSTYNNISTPTTNPQNNFFNGSITQYDNFVTTRNPDSENTLGFDIDLFNLSNPSNSVIANNQTSLNARFTTGGDVYWPFLIGMAIEIIEPDIQMVKSIDDGAGNDIAGSNVGLGSDLWYNVSFQNIGTDDAENTVITDRLPVNVDLIPADISVPAGVTYTYDPPALANGFRGELEFTIPNSLVEEGGSIHNIRLHVQVVSDCNELRDVCSNVIENQAFARYDGVEGGVSVNNEPSVSGIDACNFGIAGTSNFLVDTSGCSFTQNVSLCGPSVELIPGSGFASYEWTDSSGNIIGTGATQIVTAPGTYTVTKVNPAGVPAACVSSDETFIVSPFGTGTNPIAAFGDNILTCPNNGLELVEIYLCGDSDSREIITGVTAPTTVRWQRLSSSCTPDPDPSCPNQTASCWEDVSTDVNATTRSFSDAGQYRLEVTEPGGCFDRYYFNVFKATINPTIVTDDIICGNAGSITINNVPSGYEYAIVTAGGPTPPDSSYQASNTFSITTAGNYDIYIKNDATSCVYPYPGYPITSTDIDVDVTTSPILCAGDAGNINVQINSSVPSPYTYTISNGGSVVSTFGPTTDTSRDFPVTGAGVYTVQVTTAECSFSEDTSAFTVPPALNISAVVTKDINCNDGIITLSGSGGTPGTGYNFAIWSYTGSGTPISYTNVSDIPSSEFFTGTTYTVPSGQEGTYEFIIIDANNCSQISSAVTVVLEDSLQFTTTVNNPSCSGDTDGSITVNTTTPPGLIGYSLQYSIDGGTTYGASNSFTGLSPNTYTIDVRATKGSFTCDYTVGPIDITNPSSLSGSASLTQTYTCTQNGQITFTAATGGTGPYTYGINGVYATDLVYNNLTEGTYTISIRDTNGCQLNLPDIVIDPLPTEPTFTYNVVYNCDGTGNATITPTDASYTYTVGGITQTSNVFNNLPVGNTTVTVDYGSSCTTDVVIGISPNQEFTGTILGSTNSTCNGSDNGTIEVSASNLTGSTYEVSVDNGTSWSTTGDNPYRIVGLAAGTYDVIIRETSGSIVCDVNLGQVTITEPDLLQVTGTVTTDPSCISGGTATVSVQGSGGIPPYEYSIDNGANWQTSTVFANLAPGTYTVNIRDANSCTECGCSTDPFENGGFEDTSVPVTTFRIVDENQIAGWETTAADNRIEIWRSGFNGVPSSEGNQFAELNANLVSSLYQEFCTREGDIINWSVDHRGRSGVDVAEVRIGGTLSTTTVVETMSDGTSGWGSYSGSYTVPPGQTTTIIAFEAVSTASGSRSIGNFIDNVSMTVNQVGCTPFEIVIPNPPAVTHTAVPTACYDGTNGQIAITANTGSGDYNFSIDNGATWQVPSPTTATSYTFTGLAPGTYTVLVRDGLGCVSTASTETINTQLLGTVASTPVTCNDGSVTVTASGGDGNYEYSVVPTGNATSFQTGNVFAISTSGDYDVTIRDGLTCTYTETITVGSITNPSIVATATQPSCSGDTGSISVNISDGAADYTVTVTSTGTVIPTATSSDVVRNYTGLADGDYDFVVTDANGCISSTASVTIATPNAISSSASLTQDYTCLQNGQITFVGATGGTGPYTYGVNGVYSSNLVYNNLTQGTYVLTVRDSNGCQLNLADIVIDPLPTQPNFTYTVTYNCDGTGNATITPTDPSYTYTLGATTQTSNVFNNLTPGSHTIVVDYGRSCTRDVVVSISANQELLGSASLNSDTSCNGGSDGSISITANNFGTSYDYSIDGGATWTTGITASSVVAGGLSVGSYDVSIRTTVSSNTCTVSLGSVTIGEPTVVVASGSVTGQITCNPAAGATITPSASGGTGPYTYQLDGAGGFQSGSFSNVSAGAHTIIARDTNGCLSAAFNITVNPSTNPTHTALPTACYDGTNGQIAITASGGSGSDYNFSIDNGATWQVPSPTTATSYTFTGLAPGTFTVLVRDGFGCVSTASTETINTQLLGTVASTPVTCNDGSVTVTASGGDGSYEYSVVPTGNAASFQAGNV